MTDRQTNTAKLLEKSRSIRPKLLSPNSSRAMLTKLLNRSVYGKLNIIESGHSPIMISGNRPGPAAAIEVVDARAWQAVAVEGSAGLGRGYMEGWWDSLDPVAVISFLNLNLRSLDSARNFLASIASPISKLKHSVFKPTEVRGEDRDNIGSHYDIGNSFFELFLDETMTYSSGIFNSPDDSLTQASLNKYDRLIERTGITSGSKVLEIGTGWGGFAARAVETAGCQVTTTTISEEQYDAAAAKFTDLGITVELRKSDWRDLDGVYDQLISIEMIEAVHWRDYPAFFSKIANSLRSGGTAGIQAICVPDRNYERIKQTKDFIRKFIFPGGFLPSVELVESHSRQVGLETIEVFDMSSHYVTTLQLWRERFDTAADRLSELGLDEQFQRLWRFYLMYCESAFTQRSCTVNQILLKKA